MHGPFSGKPPTDEQRAVMRERIERRNAEVAARAPQRQQVDPGVEKLMRVLRHARAPGERGIGDTVARLFPDKHGLAAFFEVAELQCRCSDRRAWLNARWPY